MAKTARAQARDRPAASRRSSATSTASTRELLIFDALTFTLATGDEEWQAVARSRRSRASAAIKAELPGRPDLARRLERLASASAQPARAVLNSVFLHHCVEAGLDLAMVNPNHITPYAEIAEDERELADDLVFNRREDALERFIEHFESQGRGGRGGGGRPDRGHGARGGAALPHPAPQEGRRRGLDRRVGREDRRGPDAQRRAAAGDEGGRRQVRRRRADPAVRAAERRGHEAGGRAAREVPRQHRGLHEGHGRARDRVRRRARHRQVARQHDPHEQRLHGRRPRQAGPIETILEAAKEHDADAIGLSALLVSTSKQMPLCVQELHEQGLEVPGADRRRGDQPRLRPARALPDGRSPTTSTSPASSTARTRSRAWRRWTSSSTPRRARRSSTKTRDAASELREKGPEPERRPPTDDDSVRSAARTDVPVPEPPFWGVREVEVDLDEVYPHLDTHVLFKLHWGGRGVKGEAWRELVDEDFQPRLERMWREQDYLHPRALLGYFPCYSEGNEVVVLDPEDRETRARAPRLPAPAEARPHLPRRLLPPEGERRARRRRAPGRHRRRRGHRADGAARARRRVRRAAVRPRPRRADGRGHGRVAARAGPRRPRHRRRPGPPLLVGLPRRARSSPSTRRSSALLDAPAIGLRLSGGYAVEPEQSTVAIVAHHPQAVYFGMKSASCRRTRRRTRSSPAPTATRALFDEEPADGARRGRGRARARRGRRRLKHAPHLGIRPPYGDQSDRRERPWPTTHCSSAGATSCAAARTTRSRCSSETIEFWHGGARCGPGRELRALLLEPHGGGLAGFMLDARRARAARRDRAPTPSSTDDGARERDRGRARRHARVGDEALAQQMALFQQASASWRRVGAGRSPRPRRRRLRTRRRPRRTRAQLDRRGVERPQPDVAPGQALLHERGHPHHDGGRDLDRLQDDPVAERVGLRDAVGAVSTATQAAWKMPRFDGVAGSTAVTLTANSTAAAAPRPARWSSPSATSST